MLEETYQEYRKLILEALGDKWISTHQVALAVSKHDTNVGAALEKMYQEGLVDRNETGSLTRIILWRKKDHQAIFNKKFGDQHGN